MEIKFIEQQVPSDKTEKTIKDVFRMAEQIMFNYYIMVLKKDIRKIKNIYKISLTK
ncbi:MAG: hypothetical protein PHE88_11920 [Elusimicrobia bacterium]|nr:hypothetical protein [Elusimicrobiota bacterium]